MSSPRFTPIVGTLVYVWDRESDTVLLIRRNARPDDDHFGKVNGLGGKVEADESVLEGLKRELHEEAGVDMTAGRLRGTVTWTNFGPKREQWLAFVFVVEQTTGTLLEANPEGTLEWVPRQQILDACAGDLDAMTALPMWLGDRHFVPLVFDDDPRPFWGTMPYDGDQPLSWNYERF